MDSRHPRGDRDEPDPRHPRREHGKYPPGSVFISYRRGDSAGYAGRLYDRLSSRFGDEQIFMDIDTIEPGVDFVQRITQAMTSCRVVLVIIGPDWLTAADRDGNRRLDDPRDYLRMEITEALTRDVRVIPVLVHGASMPSSADLPDELRGLATRHAQELSDTRWGFDTEHLMEVIERSLRDRPSAALPSETEASSRPTRRGVPPSYLIVALIMLVAGATVWLLIDRRIADGGERPPSSSPSTNKSPPGSASSSIAPSEAAPEVIAFVSDRSGSLEIWTMNVDGTDLRQITDGQAKELVHPDWSPDGQRIAFASNSMGGDNAGGDMEIWTINTDGTDLRQLTNNVGIRDAAPDWSPDGARIAFSSRRTDGDAADEDLDIWTMNRDGQDARRLTDNDYDDDTPDWSSDGRQIVWETNPGDGHDIYRMNADGSAQVEVVAGPGDNYWPMWSPDDDSIAYRSNKSRGGDDYDIYTVTPQGDSIARLTSDGADNHRPSWSPDGRQLTFDKATGTGRAVYVVPADGGEARPLTDDSADDHAAAWRPSMPATR
jgi:Tol biopolymer transport system component